MLHRLSHDLTSYQLPDTFSFREDYADENQELIASRLIDYYFYMKSECERKNVPEIKGGWAEWSIKSCFMNFSTVLESRSVKNVSEILLKVCTTPLVSGFNSYHRFTAISQDEHARMFESYLTIDRILSLAESVGAAYPQCPYQGRWGYHDLDATALVNRIKLRIPFDISPPKAGGGAFGMQTSDGIISISDILAIYVANRANSILSDCTQKTICEIGGGSGTLACYLARTCAESIMIADLPIVSVIQGYYLMKSVGPKSVYLSGEPATPEHKIRLIPYWELDDIPSKSVSLFINTDSMPEIDHDIAEHYIALIKDKASDAFFSINQETQADNHGVVQDLVEKAGWVRRVYRFPHWMLRGYVEELYKIADITPVLTESDRRWWKYAR
jgi:putative sugar O-methyltransferase